MVYHLKLFASFVTLLPVLLSIVFSQPDLLLLNENDLNTDDEPTVVNERWNDADSIRFPPTTAEACPTDAVNYASWYCAEVDQVHEVYFDCIYKFHAYFYSSPTGECSLVKERFDYFLTLNGKLYHDDQLQVTPIGTDHDGQCCDVSTRSAKAEKANNLLKLVAVNLTSYFPSAHNCTTMLKIIHDTLGSVKDLQAIIQSCEYINITWLAPNILTGYTIDGYYISVKELNIERLKRDNETQFLFPLYNHDCNKAIYNCYGLNFTVTVEPIYCGGIGNASSTTTDTELQISPEVEYILSDEGKNNSQVIVQLLAKLDAGCASAFKSNVSILFKCNVTTDNDAIKNKAKIINETVPIVMSQNYVSTTIELEVNRDRICYGTLKWMDNGVVVQTHHIVIRTIFHRDVPYQLKKTFALQSDCALICCATMSEKETLAPSSYCQSNSDGIFKEDLSCQKTATRHPCSYDINSGYFLLYYIDFNGSITILPTSSTTQSLLPSHDTPCTSEPYTSHPSSASPTPPCHDQPQISISTAIIVVIAAIIVTLFLTSLCWIVILLKRGKIIYDWYRNHFLSERRSYSLLQAEARSQAESSEQQNDSIVSIPNHELDETNNFVHEYAIEGRQEVRAGMVQSEERHQNGAGGQQRMEPEQCQNEPQLGNH